MPQRVEERGTPIEEYVNKNFEDIDITWFAGYDSGNFYVLDEFGVLEIVDSKGDVPSRVYESDEALEKALRTPQKKRYDHIDDDGERYLYDTEHPKSTAWFTAPIEKLDKFLP